MPSKPENSIPAVSWVGEDQTLVELLYDPKTRGTAFAVAALGVPVSVQSWFDLPSGERLVPYGPTNNLITTGCVLLPSEVVEPTDARLLLNDVKSFLRRYVELSPAFEDIAAYYVLLSWVYDAFGELPYLRFRGDYGTGKTRALMTVGSLCYKPFFASGASTVSPIFHVLDAFRGTLILDEADLRFSDATAELTKILNNGNADGLPILRTMTNRHRELNPRAFRVFGPKLIAMRESFSDQALESRFLTEETASRSLRDATPIHLPRCFHSEARALRNRLLGWRFSRRFEVGVDLSRAIPGVEPRLNQTALALLSLIEDPAVRELISIELRGVQAQRFRAHAASAEGVMITLLLEAFSEPATADPAVSQIADRFNLRAAEDMGKPVSPKWVGSFLRSRLQLTPVKSRGVYILPRTQLARVRMLAERHGLNLEDIHMPE